MDEAEAKTWLSTTFDVSRETLDRIEMLVALLTEENTRQNLMSAASLADIWSRHIVDSAQLLRLADDWPGQWMDLGSGGGLPGLVLGCLDPNKRIILVESRRLRFEWLMRAADALRLSHVTVEPVSVQQAGEYRAGIITARAFAPLPKLFALAHRFSTEETLWLLPKGRSAAEELASARTAWQCDAHMEQSVTDPESAIIIARNVRPAMRRSGR